MSKVGILTLTGYGNFGNRLQNYALQQSVTVLGSYVVDTLHIADAPNARVASIARRLYRIRKEGLRSAYPWMRRATAGRAGRRSLLSTATSVLGPRNQEAIRAYVDASINQVSANDFTGPRAAKRLAREYSHFLVGSDQVWSPSIGLRDHLRFLEFAEPHQRISYAASFGVPELPARLRKTYRSGIGGMAHVSVREQRAADMVRELTGRDVPVVLDPTMLLQPAEWETLATVPQSLAGGGYVAEFFLGTATDEEMLPVQQFAADRDLDRVDLRSDTPEDLAGMGPLEFIGAIKASKLLVTDSFHAAVFATIFRVPYLLKGRGAMNSRFDTLLHKSGLPMPRWGTLRELEASIDIDWDAVHQNIARERAQSLDYLRSALSHPDGA